MVLRKILDRLRKKNCYRELHRLKIKSSVRNIFKHIDVLVAICE